MAVVALSTMWSLERFGDMRQFAEAARALGFSHVEINYAIPEEGVRALLGHDGVRVSSLHAPAPKDRLRSGNWNNEANLAASDEEERREAVAHTRRTIDYATQADARYVVVHLGGIGGEIFPEERELRRLYDAGTREGEQVEALRRACQQRRAAERAPHFRQAARSLAELAEHAGARGVALGLENRYHYHEFPSVDEMQELLAAYPAGLVGYWHDVGHAEVLHRLGLVDLYRWLPELRERLLGAHLHDVDGLADHRAPGHGTADWSYVARYLPPAAPRVLEINQRQPEEQVRMAVPFLVKHGVL